MLAGLLDKVSLGTASSYRNLTITPLLLQNGALLSIAPVSLEEALADGSVEVTEISEQGHVPELRVKNSGHRPVLILDGEELVGAKQNRIVNVTILVPPGSQVVIPVSCIEAGRWAYARPSFAAAGRVLSQNIRDRKAEAVTRNLKMRRARSADQRDVWDGVGEMLFALGAASPTSALSDAYESLAKAIEDYLAAFQPQPGQVGIISRINGRLAGVDLFGREEVFARAFPKLLRGSALQALAGFEQQHRSVIDERQFLRDVFDVTPDRFAAVGLGEELRFDTGRIGGGALEFEGGLVHLFAFPRQARADGAAGGSVA